MIIKDFKNRLYQVLETNMQYTIAQCLHTGDRVKIPSNGWDKIGFVK